MRSLTAILLMLSAALSLPAQTSILRGLVADETGAVVPGAQVTLTSSTSDVKVTAADRRGAYTFTGLQSGDYTVQASAPELNQPQPAKVSVGTGVQVLNLQLKVAPTVQQVSVDENTQVAVSTDAANNATAVVLRGQDLDALADSPEDLQADLEALAGPSAGPGGGAIYVDGFSGGELPAKESIREVRINQNPFSPEYDKLGLGRIEILTKPGADKYHASLNYNFANDIWNTRNPYSAQKAPLTLQEFENTISGPITKRSSFALDANQNNVDNGSIINAVVLDAKTLESSPLLSTFKTIQRRTRISPRIDYQLNDKNTLSLRYSTTRGDIQGAAIGGFNLTSYGDHLHYLVQTAQVIETAVIGSTINETRFQYYRNANHTTADTVGPAIQVQGSFNGGGSPVGIASDTQSNYEFQNYTIVFHGAHTWRFGARLRAQTDDSLIPQNFNGTFTFSGGLAPVLDAGNQPVLDSSGQPVLDPISSIERYRRTLLFQQLGLSAADIRARGGGATQFGINAGNPQLSAHQFDAGIFVGDDWRLLPNLTVNLGLRYEGQTNIHDARDFAPRVGLAWAPGGKAGSARPKLVVRAGFGMFYDRFSIFNTVNAERYNGVVQQQVVVTNPDFFPNIPPLSSLATSPSAQVIQQISPALRADYVIQSALTVERQLSRATTLAVTYTNTHGVHMFRSEDVNAPLPGTYNLAIQGSGMFPLGRPGPVLEMQSSGLYNQNQVITNVNSRIGQSFTLFGSYVFNRAFSNTDGFGTYPANPYNFTGEYGPAANDIHHRVNVGATINTKWNVRFSPLVTLQSGPPFDITAGSDLYGTTLFNGRPGIASDPTKPGLIQTPYGLLDPNPAPGEKLVPRNYGRGPGQASVNLRITKTFGFGAERDAGKSGRSLASGLRGIFVAPSERRYNLIVGMSARNLLNHTNPGPIVGNITSPLFGLANQMAGSVNGEGFSENADNRRLELQIRLAF